MNKSEIFNHYSHMLDTFLENTCFFQYFLQDPFSLDEDIVNPCCNLDWYVHFGATRVCFEDRAYDYVVKVDIGDRYACEKEESVYAQAKLAHLDQYFIEPIYLGTYTRTINFYDMDKIENLIDVYDYNEADFIDQLIDNEDELGKPHKILISLPLYAYQRANPYRFEHLYDELEEDEPQSEEEIIAQSFRSPLKERNLAIAIEFVRLFGAEEYARLSEFLEDWEVNDLHAANFGNIDGRFYVSDYAGYDPECIYQRGVIIYGPQ